MELELLQMLVQTGAWGLAVWLIQDMRREAKEDRVWMKNVLLYLIQRENPDFDASTLPGNPPSRIDIPIQR